MHKRLVAIASFCFIAGVAPLVGSPNNLCYDNAWQRVMEASSVLGAAHQGQLMQQADVYQAGMWPNPFFNFGVEKAWGDDKKWSDLENEITFFLTQPYIWGGKRCAAVALAQAEAYGAGWQRHLIALDLRRDLIHGMATVALLQEKLLLAVRHRELAHRQLAYEAERCEQGKASFLLRQRASLLAKQSDQLLAKATTDLTAAKESLALLWGGCAEEFDSVDYDLCALQPPQPLDLSCSHTPFVADTIASHHQVCIAKKMMTVQEYIPYSDLVFSCGWRIDRKDKKEQALIFDIGFELPLFNRNQGGIAKAQHGVTRSKLLAEQKVNEVKATLQAQQRRLTLAYEQALTFQKELQSAEEAGAAVRAGYEEGKAELLEYIEAEKALLELRNTLLNILGDYHALKTDFERTLGILY